MSDSDVESPMPPARALVSSSSSSSSSSSLSALSSSSSQPPSQSASSSAPVAATAIATALSTSPALTSTLAPAPAPAHAHAIVATVDAVSALSARAASANAAESANNIPSAASASASAAPSAAALPSVAPTAAAPIKLSVVIPPPLKLGGSSSGSPPIAADSAPNAAYAPLKSAEAPSLLLVPAPSFRQKLSSAPTSAATTPVPTSGTNSSPMLYPVPFSTVPIVAALPAAATAAAPAACAATLSATASPALGPVPSAIASKPASTANAGTIESLAAFVRDAPRVALAVARWPSPKVGAAVPTSPQRRLASPAVGAAGAMADASAASSAASALAPISLGPSVSPLTREQQRSLRRRRSRDAGLGRLDSQRQQHGQKAHQDAALAPLVQSGLVAVPTSDERASAPLSLDALRSAVAILVPPHVAANVGGSSASASVLVHGLWTRDAYDALSCGGDAMASSTPHAAAAQSRPPLQLALPVFAPLPTPIVPSKPSSLSSASASPPAPSQSGGGNGRAAWLALLLTLVLVALAAVFASTVLGVDPIARIRSLPSLANAVSLPTPARLGAVADRAAAAVRAWAAHADPDRWSPAAFAWARATAARWHVAALDATKGIDIGAAARRWMNLLG